jgi:KAP family P-loop domain
MIDHKPRALQVDRCGALDELNRTHLARRLLSTVRAVDATRGAVIGLEGAWGSGKSWGAWRIQTKADRTCLSRLTYRRK